MRLFGFGKKKEAQDVTYHPPSVDNVAFKMPKEVNGEVEGPAEYYDIKGKLREKGNVKFKVGEKDPMEIVPYNGHAFRYTEYKGFNDEVKEGIWETYHENGKVATRGNYKNGKRDGDWETYYDTGELHSKGNYEDGKKEDEWKIYHRNGKISNITGYKNNEKADGVWKGYHENGELFSAEEVKGGKTASKEYYDQKARLVEKYVTGEKEGTHSHFEAYAYHDNDQLKYKLIRDHGQGTEEVDNYDKEGKLASRKRSKDGKEIENSVFVNNTPTQPRSPSSPKVVMADQTAQPQPPSPPKIVMADQTAQANAPVYQSAPVQPPMASAPDVSKLLLSKKDVTITVDGPEHLRPKPPVVPKRETYSLTGKDTMNINITVDGMIKGKSER